jgi:DNA-binding CsgD family transcriptional regulator
MLKEQEWLAVNRTLLELYDVDQEQEFREKALNLFHILVPYTQGFWISIDENREIDLDRSVYDTMDQKVFHEYVDRYFKKDYIKFTFDMAREAMLYRDTDILEDSMRRKTEIYREFLRPNNIPYGAGVIFADEGKPHAIFALFRSGELGDFTEKDRYVLNVFKSHLVNISNKLQARSTLQTDEKVKKLDKLVKEYGLTTKEREVLQHFIQGKTNAQIGEELVISESTVKKHLHNVYVKTKVKNRIQFMALLD